MIRIALAPFVGLFVVALGSGVAWAEDLRATMSDIDVAVDASSHRLYRQPKLSFDEVTTSVDAPAAAFDSAGTTEVACSCFAPVQQAPRKRWSVTIAAYMWAANISGTSYSDGAATDVDIDFGDLFDRLDYAVPAYVEGRYDRVSLAVDFLFMKFLGNRVGPAGLVGGTGQLSMQLADFRLGYTLLCRTVGSAQWGNCCHPRLLTLDGVIGARNWDVDQDIQILGPGGGGLVLRSGNQNWWDGYVGARLRWQFHKRWAATLYGDIGGFGIGNSASLTWQLQATLRYYITRGFWAGLGYRAIDVDRVEGTGLMRNGVDLTFHGILLGFGVTI